MQNGAWSNSSAEKNGKPIPSTIRPIEQLTIANCQLSISLSLYHRVPQHTQSLDLHFHHVAALQEHGRLPRDADTGRRAGEDQIARLQRENLRQVSQDSAHA